MGKGCWLQKGMGEAELAAELTEFMAYFCARKGNKESTIAGKLVAVQFYHEQVVGLSLSLGNQIGKTMNQEGTRREGCGAEIEQPTEVGYADENAREHSLLGVGGTVVWIGLALSYFLVLRASELLAGEKGEFHSIYCLRSRGVAFFINNEQLGESRRQEADKVEVRFRGSKGDQGR